MSTLWEEYCLGAQYKGFESDLSTRCRVRGKKGSEDQDRVRDLDGVEKDQTSRGKKTKTKNKL